MGDFVVFIAPLVLGIIANRGAEMAQEVSKILKRLDPDVKRLVIATATFGLWKVGVVIGAPVPELALTEELPRIDIGAWMSAGAAFFFHQSNAVKKGKVAE